MGEWKAGRQAPEAHRQGGEAGRPDGKQAGRKEGRKEGRKDVRVKQLLPMIIQNEIKCSIEKHAALFFSGSFIF